MKSSRRRFLESALGAPLAAGLRKLSPSDARPIAPTVTPGQTLFESPHFIRFDSHCFTINDRDSFVFSAAFHYPRCPRALWRDRLLKLKQAGFNAIETYVFWNYHEPEEGRADLNEFEDFVKLVQEMGLWMIARPGPYVCAEWDRGGFPSWVTARRIPLRSNHPESLKTSQQWFDLVLPIIQRHQVTASGPIIMMQLENEYDYWKLTPDAEKKDYLRALARMAWNAGIKVPLITCWTKQARENSDPDMARIMDTCNFYPRWQIMPKVAHDLEKLRHEEPEAPLQVTELQGGWFSQLGGKLSTEQEGITGQQLNLLTKTVIEQGVTSFNCYMGFGGTNFDWAAKTITTTYDYAAPIREPGGLWEKYYAARGVGAFLSLFGTVLTRAQRADGAGRSTNQDVSVTERINGKSAVVFVRENSNAEQRYKMMFRDPNSPTQRIISVPRVGELVLGPREMKMIPVQVPIPGSHLRYSTAEVLAYGLNLDRDYVIIYDDPGRVAEIAFATKQEPRIEGDTLYQYWDPEYESGVIGLRVEKAEKLLLVNNHLLVVAVPRERALRTWTADFPPDVVSGAEETKPISVPFITDSYLMAASGSYRNRIWADLDFLPGEHNLAVLLPPSPTQCRVDGTLTDFHYDRPWRTARLSVTTPPLADQPMEISEVETWVEEFNPASGDWLSGPLRPLEELGAVPYGYVKYRAEYSHGDQPYKMFLTSFADDAKMVFLNGKMVPPASNSNKQVEFLAAPYFRFGNNTIEISYECFGSPNVGDNLGELKGIQSAHIGLSAHYVIFNGPWQIQRSPPPMRGRQIDPEFSQGGWKRTSLQGLARREDLIPAFTWCRAGFILEKPSDARSAPWKLTFEADRDALLYLNGKFVGRYVTAGPQSDFYLPEPYLVFGPKKNTLTILLAYTDSPAPIRQLRLSPYDEFSTRRTRVEFAW